MSITKHIMAVLYRCTCGYSECIRGEFDGDGAHDDKIGYDEPVDGTTDTMTIEYICTCGYNRAEDFRCDEEEHTEISKLSMHQ